MASNVGTGLARYAVMPNPLLHRGMVTRTVERNAMDVAGGTTAEDIAWLRSRDREDEWCLPKPSRRSARLTS